VEKHTTLAVDLGKSVYEVAVSQHPGRVAERHRLSRPAFERFLAERPAATVLMEACGSAHHWGRVVRSLGHEPVLLPAHGVKPYVLRNKTDRSDARALLEALRNADLFPVPVKTVAQHALTALHRTRSAWMATRTARINLGRGLLREFGIPIPVGSAHVVPRILELLHDSTSAVPHAIRPTLDSLCSEIRELERRIKAIEKQLAELARDIPATNRLLSVPGIGLLTATALVAFVGDVGRFASGRRFASYLGLTPRERSSGNVRRLGSISKRGDAYIRMLLTHGARAVLRSAVMAARSDKKLDPLRAWAVGLQQRRGHNRATIALANKLARIAWAVWKRDQPFQDRKAA